MYQITVESEAFKGVKTLQQHRMVNEVSNVFFFSFEYYFLSLISQSLLEILWNHYMDWLSKQANPAADS